MKRTLSYLHVVVAAGGLAVSAPAARAQQPAPAQAAPKTAAINVNFKDGKQLPGSGFHVSPDGASLLVTQQIAGGGTGEIGYPLALIETVDFPEPAQIAVAQEQLVQGKDSEALAGIEPVAAYYSQLRYVPGNWWLPAALVKLDALAGLKREGEVDALLAEVARIPRNTVAAEAVKLRTAEALLRRGNSDKADAIFDDLIKTSADDSTLARAWIAKGRIHLERREFEPSLLAYLHVPVFYPDNRRQLADALLGSGRAFVGIDNRDKARDAFQEVITDFATTPDAAEAKAELDKITPSNPGS